MLKNRILLFWVFFFAAGLPSAHGQRFTVRRFDTSAIHRECRRMVSRLAGRGYPFASVVADSAVVSGRRRVDVYCSTILSQKYHVENIYMLGGAGLSPYYVHSAAGISPGAVYDERRISMAARRIESGGAADVLRDAEVEFHPDGVADDYLYLQKRRSNAVGAGVALNRDNLDGSYFLTGNALADLRNNFGHGESFCFAWNGYDRRSQMLDLKSRWPYAFDTPVSPDFCVNVTKTDSTCLTFRLSAGLGWTLTPDVEVRAVADVRRLVSTADGGSDARTSLYGIAFGCRKSTQNHTIVNITASASGGARRCGGQSGSTAEISSALAVEIPVCVWVRYEGSLTAKKTYFGQPPDIHECSPIGGAGSLRGFIANEFRATGVVSACNTVRLLLSDGFSVQVFYDQAYYRCNAAQVDIDDAPCGFGAGIGVKTGSIILDIGWAIGCERGKMRPLKDAKTLIVTRLAF